VGKTKCGKGMKLIALADRAGLPLAVYTASATLHEITLVPHTLTATFTAEHPECLIGGKANDSDPLDAGLAAAGFELIGPHRTNRGKRATQDACPLQRYRSRWSVEICQTHPVNNDSVG
jgi:hypothetical protein